MARFNSPSLRKVANIPNTTNVAGGAAFKASAKLDLAQRLLTSMCSDTYYKTAAQGMADIAQLVQTIDDPLFAAKAAIFTRTKGNLRSVSHLVAGEIAARVKGEKWTRPFFRAVVQRPDDVTEILSYYQAAYGSKFPNALKDGLGQALTKFDTYQLFKYRGNGNNIKLVDAVNICHPKATEALTCLMKNAAPPASTWEAKLSAAGKAGGDVAEAKAEAWGSLLREHKLGYFAALRNLRNIIQQAPDALPLALELIADPDRVKKSGVLPFQFYTAMTVLHATRPGESTMLALNAALEASMASVPTFPGKTLIAVDSSGSMQGQPIERAALFAAVLFKSQPNADMCIFDTEARWHNPNALDSLMSIAATIKGKAHGGGTSFTSIFQLLDRRAFDRVIILSDMESWEGNTMQAYAAWKRSIGGANPYLYTFNLQAQDGTLQFPEKKVFCLAGWSDAILATMQNLESDPQALIHEIEAITL